MTDFSDILHDFMRSLNDVERDMCKTLNAAHLPDEIDLYNFFEQWGGRAEFRLYEGAMTAYSIDDYVMLYEDSISIRYHIGKAKYYALRFNGRGVFLVSENRYNELNAKKGK